MKDSSITTLELDVKIRKIFNTFLKEKHEEENYPQKASLDSNLALDKQPVGVRLSLRKYKMLLCYVMLYHYGPLEPSILCYYHLDLIEHLSSSESYWLSVLLENKELFLKYLICQETMTEQQFFSGICNVTKITAVQESIKLLFEEKQRKPRRLVRRKGYRDKGSLGNPSTSVIRKEYAEDFYLTLLQFKKEQEEIIRSENCILLKEYLQEGRVLTDEQLVEFRIKKGDLNEQRTNRKSSEENYCKQRDSLERSRKEEKLRRKRERIALQTSETRTSITDPTS